MYKTSGRLLALLGLLQSRTIWSGAELAERLEVSGRTVRNDIERLRQLDYPVEAVRGPAGHYRLGIGAKLPPLLLDDDEAVAVAVGLRAITGVSGIEDTSARALAKLEAVLPHRLRLRVNAVRNAVETGPKNTGTNAADPEVDAALLMSIAAAIRDHEEIRFYYRGDERLQVEPYRLVSWQRRWYLVARDAAAGTWSSFRLDWMQLRVPGGRRFRPVELPGGDYPAFVLRTTAFAGWQVHVRITVYAPAAKVLSRINPTVGVVEAIDENTCVLVTGADSVETVAVYIGMLGLDFRVSEPPELVAHLATLAKRYAKAVSTATVVRMERRERQDINERSDRAISTEATLRKEPIEKADSAEPMDPIDSIEPTEPMDSTDPRE
jgi:predicted DNA-binding transcriptional regulator YafY